MCDEPLMQSTLKGFNGGIIVRKRFGEAKGFTTSASDTCFNVNDDDFSESGFPESRI